MGSGLGAGQGRLLLWVCQWQSAVLRKFWEPGDDTHSSASIKGEIQRESELWASRGSSPCADGSSALSRRFGLLCF